MKASTQRQSPTSHLPLHLSECSTGDAGTDPSMIEISCRSLKIAAWRCNPHCQSALRSSHAKKDPVSVWVSCHRLACIMWTSNKQGVLHQFECMAGA